MATLLLARMVYPGPNQLAQETTLNRPRSEFHVSPTTHHESQTGTSTEGQLQKIGTSHRSRSTYPKASVRTGHKLFSGFYAHLFTVPKKSGGFRPVTDLMALNRHIRCPHFHMETDRSIRSQIQQGEWTTSIDFPDAYLHVPVAPEFRKYLRLHILGKTYQFKAMGLGLNITPRVFTKLLVPVASFLRCRGIHLH